jgi:hypothetical protein
VAAQQCVERRLIAGLSGGDEGDVVRSADDETLLGGHVELGDLGVDSP